MLEKLIHGQLVSSIIIFNYDLNTKEVIIVLGPNTVPTLRQITAEDVGLEAGTAGTNDNQDPLLNMLMRLQEAANYNENQEQDSDCASLDSNFTHDSSAAADP